jgi:hypothetical protein
MTPPLAERRQERGAKTSPASARSARRMFVGARAPVLSDVDRGSVERLLQRADNPANLSHARDLLAILLDTVDTLESWRGEVSSTLSGTAVDQGGHVHFLTPLGLVSASTQASERLKRLECPPRRDARAQRARKMVKDVGAYREEIP